jgi:DNA-binding NarL/FixJ family response regulator
MSLRCLLSQALVESDSDAAEHARSIAIERGLAFDAACALARLGAIRGDAEVLAAAHEELGRIGAVVRQRGVTHELRKLGRRAPRQRRSGTLTAVEAEIAELVAEGLSNRQIAERALLSPKTVEVYLSRIYAKLRCRSRVELAVFVNGGRLASAASDGGDSPPVGVGAP